MFSLAGRADQAFAPAVVVANQPMGTAKGIFPGRVVWVHNSSAVNQNAVVNAAGHGWYLRENNNQTVIDEMVSTALQNLTGKSSDSAAWDAIFKYHNTTRGKGAVGYSRGEKVFIKINATSAWTGNFNPADLTAYTTAAQTSYPYVSETSVGPVLAMLRQLVNVVGVAQQDIYVGDPLKHVYKHLYDVWHGEFPNVHYLDYNGYTQLGREGVVPGSTAVIYYSDRGTISMTGPGGSSVHKDYLYTISQDAEYVINLPMLKGHKRAGMTMFAKNNFGSQTRADASHLHNGLVGPTEMPNDVSRSGYGLYRVQVDIMGHSLLGKKNLVYLMDALWATDFELDVPLRWQMQPFANSFPASVFASLDPVAIESVGYDFLRSEFTADRVPAAGTYVQTLGVDDYLHQAADAANWPAGIAYDPDNSGTPISSLGTHEHWNNAAAKQYSRNLAPAGTGIELVQTDQNIYPASLVGQTAAPGGTAVFGVTTAGAMPSTYLWQRQAAGTVTWTDLSDNATYTGTGTATLTVRNATSAMSGDSFRCVLTNSNATATTSPATMVVNPPLTVVTLAGLAGSSGFPDGTGSAARFASPSDVAVDSTGNVYVADTRNHTVRKVTSAGVVTTVAGQAGASGSADGTGSAKFNWPTGVAIDGAGNVYVADTDNDEIRKVTPAGAVSTLAGVAGVTGSSDGSGSAARFYGPSGIVGDAAGNLYIADTLNNTIRKLTPAGLVSTIAGAAGATGAIDAAGSAARFYGPQGLALDSSGNLYVADTNNSALRKIVLASGAVTTVAGQAGIAGYSDGASSQALFRYPSGVAVDGSGNLYVVDTENSTLREVAASGLVSTLAGSTGSSGAVDGVGTAARFAIPTGVAVNATSDIYVADTNNQTVRFVYLPAAAGISQQPQSQIVAAGANVTFTVTATGKPAPTYQWYLNGTVRISGATSNTLSLTNVQTSDAGNYSVTVTNNTGTATSNTATLTVTVNTPSGGGGSSGGGGGGGASSVWFLGLLSLLALARRSVRWK